MAVTDIKDIEVKKEVDMIGITVLKALMDESESRTYQSLAASRLVLTAWQAL
jgi:hypothetical protein